MDQEEYNGDFLCFMVAIEGHWGFLSELMGSIGAEGSFIPFGIIMNNDALLLPFWAFH
jgi:hypothetical protein